MIQVSLRRAQVEQCKPTRQRHCHPERRLLAGRYDCQCRSGAAPDNSGNIQPFCIDRHSCQSHAGQAERSSSERKAWILDPSSHPFKLKPSDRQAERTGETAVTSSWEGLHRMPRASPK